MAEGEGAEEPLVVPEDEVTFRVVWKKNSYTVTFPLTEKALKVKEHIQTLTGIPPAMMKLMYKGLVKDESSLSDLKITSGAKMMVIGSTISDVITVQTPLSSNSKVEPEAITFEEKERFCNQSEHKKILDKGIPDDVPPGYRDRHDKLPDQPLSGMLNKLGSKVRLHFRKELDQLWLGTKERTEKIPMGSVKKVVSEPIVGHEEYHIMAIQLGSTDLSRYWIYWVPSNYVEAIKDSILGKWQYF